MYKNNGFFFPLLFTVITLFGPNKLDHPADRHELHLMPETVFF